MSRNESSIFFTLMYFLLIFLFTRKIQAREVKQQCSSSCGDIKNITHPFYLKGDPRGCATSLFELSCQSNKTVLEFHSSKYYVKRISYENNTISVVDINLANGICSFPYNSMWRFPYTYNFYLLRSKYTFVSFMNCSRNITEQACTRVPCLSESESNVYIKYDAYSVSDLPESCSFISKVPILDVRRDYPSNESIWNLLELGFDLRWDLGFYLGWSDTYSASAVFKIIQPIIDVLSQIEIKLELLFFLYDTYDPATLWELLYSPGPPFDALIVGRFIFAPVALLVFLIHKYRKTLERVDNVEKFLHNQQSWMPKRYTYPEIIAMTNHFKDKLGQGGFGSVYKGQHHSGYFIAVKMLENSKFSGEEFINEVSTIGRIHHVNVVQLLGFCSEGSKRALIYEYMPNGSLDKHIFSKGSSKGQSFSWEKLQEIALGIARGIEYLHEGCDVCILHFDIKPHNILLDHNLIPKVSDFGLAKFYPKENDFVSISVMRGTIGYIAPELISRNFGIVSCKSDVYSFGMLLLEMAGGRRNSNMNATHSSKEYFPSWVYEQIKNKGGDLQLGNMAEIESMIAKKLSMIGLWCIQVKATDRPSMTKILEMLEGSIDDLQMPPKPFFSSSRHVSGREIESDSSIDQLLVPLSIEEGSFNDSYV